MTTRDSADLRVEIRPIASVKAYGKNPRKISDRAVEMVARSLSEFGWRQPLVVDPDGVLLAGHTRLKAARSLKMTHVPVHVADGLTEDQAKAYRIADNRSHDFTDWDPTVLMAELDGLEGFEELLGLADWQQIIAEAEDALEDAKLDVDEDVEAEVWAGFELTVVCATAESREAVEALLGDVEGVTDVRRKL